MQQHARQSQAEEGLQQGPLAASVRKFTVRTCSWLASGTPARAGRIELVAPCRNEVQLRVRLGHDGEQPVCALASERRGNVRELAQEVLCKENAHAVDQPIDRERGEIMVIRSPVRFGSILFVQFFVETGEAWVGTECPPRLLVSDATPT